MLRYELTLVIGIGGPSCSGKSTLACGLAGEINASHISLDDYFYREGHPSYREAEYGSYPDCDRYEAIDWDSALQGVQETPRPLVVEGFLLLGYSALSQLCDLKIYVDVPEPEIRKRRFEREPTHPPKYMDEILLPRNRELVVPTKSEADIVLDGTKSTAGQVPMVLGAIRNLTE